MLLSEYLAQAKGKPICLKVYNMIQRGTRLVTFTPSVGTTTEQMLQVKLRFENYVDAHTYIISIKDVYLGGPAHRSGFQPFTDFILGTNEIVFKDLATFSKFLIVNKG